MNVFSLYSNCIPVKGFSRSIICDLQIGRYKFIPNDLYNILKDNAKICMNIIEEKYGIHNYSIIEGYLNFLNKNQFGFWVDNTVADNFITMSNKYESSSSIENAIIDFETQTFEVNNFQAYERVVQELEYLGCKAVMLRFFSEELNENVKKVLKLFDNTRIKHISLLIKHSYFSNEFLLETFKSYLRVFNVAMHSSPKNENMYFEKECLEITKTTQEINDSKHCGYVHPKMFVINLNTFTESLDFNSCLNRKISIDAYGNIKNCPSINKSYGNIRVESLINVCENETFRKVWNINKDSIHECMVCEFRYICQDCRGHLPDGSLEKPVHCKYDPYKGEWNF